MPVNVIRVTQKKKKFTCLVYDHDGVAHNISPMFRNLSDQTLSGSPWTEICLGPDGATCVSTFKFQPIEKVLDFEAEPPVVRHILEAAKG